MQYLSTIQSMNYITIRTLDCGKVHVLSAALAKSHHTDKPQSCCCNEHLLLQPDICVYYKCNRYSEIVRYAGRL